MIAPERGERVCAHAVKFPYRKPSVKQDVSSSDNDTLQTGLYAVSMMEKSRDNSGYLADWRKAKGLTQEELAEAMDTTKSTVSKLESGRMKETTEWLGRAAKALGLQVKDLLAPPSGHGPVALEYAPVEEFESPPKRSVRKDRRAVMTENGARGIEQGEIVQIDAELGLGLRTPPDVVTVEISAGSVELGAPVLDTWRVPNTVLARRTRTSPQNVFFVECDGDSMEPLIKDGDVVLVDQTRRDPNMPGVFALYEGNGCTLKRVEIVRGSDPPMFRLSPANPAYMAYEVLAADVYIIGRYIARFTAA